MLDASRRDLLLGVGGAIVASLAGCLDDQDDSDWELEDPISLTSATQYQGPNCDCCDEYAAYLDDQLETDLETVVTDELGSIKDEYGIADELRSCHTLELDGYVVEGHVPAEVIATLLEEKPAIDGIALPGMPAGSPGMGGDKDGPWTVYELGSGSGDDTVFTEL